VISEHFHIAVLTLHRRNFRNVSQTMSFFMKPLLAKARILCDDYVLLLVCSSTFS